MNDWYLNGVIHSKHKGVTQLGHSCSMVWCEMRRCKQINLFEKRACITIFCIWKWAAETQILVPDCQKRHYSIENRLFMIARQWSMAMSNDNNHTQVKDISASWSVRRIVNELGSNCWSYEHISCMCCCTWWRERDQGPYLLSCRLIPDPFCVTSNNRITLFCYQCDTLPQKVMVLLEPCKKWSNHNVIAHKDVMAWSLAIQPHCSLSQ